METEIWKDVVDFEGFYQVSNLGRVQSCDRIVVRNGQGDMNMKGKMMAKYQSTFGYCPISLYKDGKCKKTMVHIVVAHAFIGERPLKNDINHIDGDKSNNSVSNLEYCTRSENMIHAFQSGLCKNTNKKQKTGFNAVKWMVMNEETGIFYESIAEAARAHCVGVGRLEKQLKGIRVKNLPFVRIEKGVNQEGVSL
jgi:hypothetical protein